MNSTASMRGRCFFCTYASSTTRIGMYRSLRTGKHYGKHIRGPKHPQPPPPTATPSEGVMRASARLTVSATLRRANCVCLKPPPPARVLSPTASPALLLATHRVSRRVARSPTRCAVTHASVGPASISLRLLSGCYHGREYNLYAMPAAPANRRPSKSRAVTAPKINPPPWAA